MKKDPEEKEKGIKWNVISMALMVYLSSYSVIAIIVIAATYYGISSWQSIFNYCLFVVWCIGSWKIIKMIEEKNKVR